MKEIRRGRGRPRLDTRNTEAYANLLQNAEGVVYKKIQKLIR